jgi:hypothetical protein
VTRYVLPQLGAPRIDRQRIPAGLAGTKRTAAHVGRLIRDGSSDFYVRQKAIDILLARGVPAKDYIGEIDALFRWVQRHVRYTKDPFRVEVLHSPRRMLELRAGDCDDMTILLGSLVKSVGHPVRIVLTGPNAERPDLFSHIYLEAQHQGDWIPLDATMPFGMGWSPRAPVRMVLSIEEDSNDDHAATRTATTARPANPANTCARARVAPRTAARDPQRRRAAARPPGQGPVVPLAPPAGPVAKRVDANHPASHLAERSRPATSPPHHATNAGVAEGMGNRERATTPAPADRPDETTAAGHAASRGDGTADAGIATASALYRRFTRFPARSLTRVPHRRLVPPVVVDLGRLMAIVYRSDKWVGYPRTYIHRMDTPPRLACDVGGRQLFVIGGDYRVTARGIEG